MADKTDKVVAAKDDDVRIVVAQRGWVFVGYWTQKGDEVTLLKARCVRRWGTTTGLGQIASAGPTADTTLDDGGTLRLHRLGVVVSYDCNPKPWKQHLL